jgi:hypothetical protein
MEGKEAWGSATGGARSTSVVWLEGYWEWGYRGRLKVT